jgi:hypothetical protein
MNPNAMFSVARPSPRCRRMLAVVVLSLAVAAGCGDLEYRPNAVGQEGVISVVIDSTRWNDDVGETIRSTLGEYIGTLPNPEPTFELKQVNLSSQGVLDQVMKQKNVLFVAPLTDTTNVAKFIKGRLTDEAQQAIQSGERAVVQRPDLWRRDQMVVYVAASTPSDLAETIEEEADDLRYIFNTITRTRVRQNMFDKGRQQNLEAELMEEYGFAVNVQHDYVIALDTTDFVWLRRIVDANSWRSLFVHYVENANPAVLDPEWIYQTRDSLTQRYLQGNLGGFVEIDRRRPLETENIDFLGRYGFETRGLWHMVGFDEGGEKVQYGMGGPFLTYTFYDRPTGRLYMIDGMVFAPGFDKREFLRHMEVIAYTFRTQAELEEDAPEAEVADRTGAE